MRRLFLLLTFPGLLGCGGGGAAIQTPTVKDWWQESAGTQWLFQPTRQLSYLIRVDVVDDGVQVAGVSVMSYAWSKGSEEELWPSADPTTPLVAPFQTLYFTYTNGKGIRYFGRESLDLADAWDNAMTFDTPVQFASEDVIVGETSDSQAGATTWHSDMVEKGSHSTFFEPDMETLVVDLTEDSETFPEVGRYWLSPYRGIVAFENGAYVDTDSAPIRFDLSNYLD